MNIISSKEIRDSKFLQSYLGRGGNFHFQFPFCQCKGSSLTGVEVEQGFFNNQNQKQPLPGVLQDKCF